MLETTLSYSKTVLSTMYHCLFLKIRLYDASYRLRFYSNSLIHTLRLSNSHNNVASIQRNRGDESHRVIVAIFEIPISEGRSLRFTFKVSQYIQGIPKMRTSINKYCSVMRKDELVNHNLVIE